MLEQSKMSIKISSFKKELEKAYLAGCDDKALLIKKLKETGKDNDPLKEFNDIFGGGLFGK